MKPKESKPAVVKGEGPMHTPGPWNVVEELDVVAPCVSDCFHDEEWADQKHDIEIATTGTSIQRFYETAKANARLIAAAPELLEAALFVKQFLVKLEEGTELGDPLREIRRKFHKPLHDKLEAAIKKAVANE